MNLIIYAAVLKQIALLLRAGDAKPHDMLTIVSTLEQIIFNLLTNTIEMNAEDKDYKCGYESVIRCYEWGYEELKLHSNWCENQIKYSPDNTFLLGRYVALGELKESYRRDA